MQRKRETISSADGDGIGAFAIFARCICYCRLCSGRVTEELTVQVGSCCSPSEERVQCPGRELNRGTRPLRSGLLSGTDLLRRPDAGPTPTDASRRCLRLIARAR